MFFCCKEAETDVVKREWVIGGVVCVEETEPVLLLFAWSGLPY